MRTPAVLLIACALLLLPYSSTAQSWGNSVLDDAFRGAQVVDLTKSNVPSVVKLRSAVKIPPPPESVLVKAFSRDQIPPAIQPAFAEPNVKGVTINGRYVAILHTEFSKEYDDVLAHELVHAYISLASPRELPKWFQEGSAVHFSTDKDWSIYAKPAGETGRVLVGRRVDLPNYYTNKLHNFHYLIERVGKPKFYKWYKEAVVTGTVNARPLLGLTATKERTTFRKPVPIWAIALAVLVMAGISVAGYYAMRREKDIW